MAADETRNNHATSPARGAGDNPAAASGLRTRMVPAGTHFAPASPHAPQKEAPHGSGRPAGKRFAAPACESALEEHVGRPAGKRFAPARPAGDEPPSSDAVTRPAGTRFARQGAAPVAARPAPASAVPHPAEQPKKTPVAPAVDAQQTASLPGEAFAGLSEESARAAALESLGAPVASSQNAAASGPRPAPETPRPASRPATPQAPKPAARPAPSSARQVASAKDEPSQHAGATVRRKRRVPVLAIILIVIGVALLFVAGGLFLAIQMRYQQAQESYEELESYTVESDMGDGVPSVDFDALSAINSDIVGWIYIPGTPVNYPVVQTDDNTTYLKQLFDGTPNDSGAIFMDMANTPPGMYDQQTTLYGHHTYDGTMFQVVDNSTDQAEFDKIQTAYYITRSATFVMTPLLTAQVEDTYIQARQPNFLGEGESLTAYLEDMLAQAKAQAPDAAERIEDTEQVMSLVTCAGEIIPRTTRAVMVLSVDQIVAHGV
ncbi:class B sortase [Collinsella sp. An271]|uniref:class B sortase n=1 Tax=Collinsella sp. An271 TaxID=1965616 RepID=UPI001EF43926|nr:class B sortase [Collinsella sp. An271]